MDRRRLGSGILILDGATGTELLRRGVPTPIPLWSAGAITSHPDVVEAVHRDYAAAGADIVVANTFRTNVRTLQRAGLLDQGPALNRKAVELARRAGPDIWVAGSIAPVEDCYRPDLVPDEASLNAEHRQMARWLADAGADLLWIETMGTILEARVAAMAARLADRPFIVSFVVRENGDLLSGEPLEKAVAEVGGALAVGLNCIPPKGMTRNLPRLRKATDLPVIAYAHIGNPEPTQGWSFSEDMSSEAYAAEAMKWRAMGATILGGCCGTTPEHIRALADALSGETSGRAEG